MGLFVRQVMLGSDLRRQLTRGDRFDFCFYGGCAGDDWGFCHFEVPLRIKKKLYSKPFSAKTRWGARQKAR
jgi:hypothetical protein